LFHSLFQTENETIVSAIFGIGLYPIYPIVSISFSNGKANNCFNNFTASEYSQSLYFSNLFFKWKTPTVVSTTLLPWIIDKVSTVSIIFLIEKSNRCLKQYFGLGL